ncbi:MAG: lysophospholipase [Gammaproteobacteria bacterium]|jgi:alpha-beta hydrolase superfamily lysophospholipase
MTRALLCLLIISCLGSCTTPRIQQKSSITQYPRLTPDHLVMDDGYLLPLASWQAGGEPDAVVLALHGFNDYRNAFADVAPALTAAGIQLYAYDQRGFGETHERGIWPGSERLQMDAAVASKLLCLRHPGVPLFLLGESMGGAIAMLIQENAAPGCIDGLVLVAPAVWGWRSMPLYQQAALWLAAHTWPEKTLTGEGLDIRASDNIEMLRAQGRNPLVIKETRIDSMYGLAALMESAQLASSQLGMPALILYGERDEIIPAQPLCEMLANLPRQQPRNWRLALYPQGYHMLTRDLQASTVLADIVEWLRDRQAALPSGLEVSADAQRLQTLCNNR